MLPPIFVPSQSPSLTQFEVNTNNETQSLLSLDQLAEDLLPLVPIPPVPVSGGDICPKQSCVMKPTIEDVCNSEDDEDEEIDELMQGHLSCSSSGVPDWSYLCNKIDKVLDKVSWYASSACPPTISNHLQLHLPTLRCHSDAHCASSHNHATPVAGLNSDQCLISPDLVPMSRATAYLSFSPYTAFA